MTIDVEAVFGPKGRVIRKIAVERFFDRECQLPLLQRMFSPDAPLDKMLHWRRRPYKFGAKLILEDEGGTNAGKYHLNMYTSYAFELMKVLSDISGTISETEAEHIRNKINDCMVDKGKDLASIHIEAHFLHSLRSGAERITVGDGEAHPDLRLTAGGAEFDIQCKSVSIGEQSEKALRGFHWLAYSLKKQQPKLAVGGTHSAWQLVDPVALASADAFEKAREQLVRYCTACAERSPPQGMDTDILRLLGDVPVKSVRLSDFISLMDGNISFQTDRAALDCNVLVSAPPPDTEWSFTFYSPRNIKELTERCEKRFEEAMRQHEAMGSKRPVVVINVEASMFVDDAAAATGQDPLQSPVVQRALALNRHGIEALVARNRKWKHCNGMVLVFSAPPLLHEGGIFWRRMLSWSSPTGGVIDAEFPVLRSAMMH